MAKPSPHIGTGALLHQGDAGRRAAQPAYAAIGLQYGSKGGRHSPIFASLAAGEIYAAVDTGGQREVNGAALE